MNENDDGDKWSACAHWKWPFIEYGPDNWCSFCVIFCVAAFFIRHDLSAVSSEFQDIWTLCLFLRRWMIQYIWHNNDLKRCEHENLIIT